MRVLVTGGAGFIGSHLVEALLAEGHSVSVIDDFNDFYDPKIKKSNLQPVLTDVRLHSIDIRDKDAVLRAFATERPDAVVHLAARAGVRPSIQHPEIYLSTNINGTFHLLEASKEHKVTRFIFASSSSVYGASTVIPFREDQVLTQTLSPYASTKLAGEHLCSNYSYLYDMGAVCLRFFTVYGPRQRPDLAIHKFTDLIHRGKPVDVYGDGTARRDFTYIDDVIQGVLAAVHRGDTLFDIFNLGESETTELRELIVEIEAVLGKKAKINRLPPVPGDMPATCADISKARRLLGYAPATQIHSGLRKFIEWYLRAHAL
ncbi:MAG: GDP-mannose 4,6-dehydratase [Verrucomicrobia bacterium]|nr:GDP-mannose 4,6-dehydratase [Verrucomicrobiota bacterium]